MFGWKVPQTGKGSYPAMVTPAPPPHFFDDDFKIVISFFFAHLKNINNVSSTVACALLLTATTATFVPGGCDIIPFHRQFVKLLLPIFVTNSVMTLHHCSKSCIFAILCHQFCATAQPPLKIIHFCNRLRHRSKSCIFAIFHHQFCHNTRHRSKSCIL